MATSIDSRTKTNGNGNGSATKELNKAADGVRAEHPAQVDEPQRVWSVQDSTRLYGIRNWGHGYFAVNDEGHVTVHPRGEASI
jgi:arginine decarboxylase-like protein